MSQISIPIQIQRRFASLPPSLQQHIYRSRKIGAELAAIHNVDPRGVDIGITAHDLARHIKPDKLLNLSIQLGLSPNRVETYEPILLHGPVAAAWLKSDGYTDTQILDAVRYHSTGKTGMCMTGKIVFLADKLDPCKISKNPLLADIKTLAKKDIDQSLLGYLSIREAELVNQGKMIHPESINFRKELIQHITN